MVASSSLLAQQLLTLIYVMDKNKQLKMYGIAFAGNFDLDLHEKTQLKMKNFWTQFWIFFFYLRTVFMAVLSRFRGLIL